MEVLLCGGGDDVVMVGHQDEVVDFKSIFFSNLRQDFGEDADGFLPVEPEGPIVGSADQMVGIFSLDDTEWASHDVNKAHRVPRCSDTGIREVEQTRGRGLARGRFGAWAIGRP
jgi:hypothetical protein